MVRKTTRAATLKAKSESLRKSQRRRSSSKSEDSDDNEKLSKLKKTVKSQSESGTNSDTDSKKPLKKRTRSKKISESNKTEKISESNKTVTEKTDKKSSNEQQKDAETEEVNEKGKSKSINNNKSNDNGPTENDETNAQVTEQSPKDDNNADDPSANNDNSTMDASSSEIVDVNISQSLVAEMTCDDTNQQSNDGGNVNSEEQVKADEEVEIKEKQTEELIIEKSSKKAIKLKRPSIKPVVEDSNNENKKDVEPEKSNEKVEKIQEETEKIEETTVEIQEESEKVEEKNQEKSPTEQPNAEVPRPNVWGSSYESKEDPESKEDSESKEVPESKGVPEAKEVPESKEVAEPKEKTAFVKQPQRKRITLKRTKADSVSRASQDKDLDRRTSLEDKKQDRRISLEEKTQDKKDSNLERSVSVPEKSVKRRSSTSDHIVINDRRRRSTASISEAEKEKSISESEDKPQKSKIPTKVVKLVRNSQELSQEPPPPGEDQGKKFKWTKKIVLDDIRVFSFNTLKELCPEVQLLDESEVNLEILPEKPRRKTYTELEEEEMESIEAELNSSNLEMKEAMDRKISIVDDMASKLKPPPSPPKNTVSEVLFITNLVRPFTVKQLKELLERTGKIREDGFWTDKIKSKCYVCYETTEEAEATRNALHGIHWPVGNGKKLIIDYATVKDMENAKTPIVVQRREKTPEKENRKLEPKPVLPEERYERKHVKRDWEKEKDEDSQRRRSRSRERGDRKTSWRSYTPEDHQAKKRRQEPAPQKAMDDLFLKTKATPSIYWQPLSPEEISLKQQQRQQRLEENKRRVEEIRSRGPVNRGERRDRNFRRR